MEACIFAAFLIGLFVRMYKFTDALPGRDSPFNIYGAQNIVKLGRWFLAVACSFSFFALPWVNGILSFFWIGVTAVIVAGIFRMENPVLIVLTGGLSATFPAVTQTFYYGYTADGYMLFMVLAALAVRFSVIGETRKTACFWLLSVLR